MVVGNGSCRIAGNIRGFAHDIDLPGVESGGAARATGPTGDAGSLGQSKPGREPDANHHEFGIE